MMQTMHENAEQERHVPVLPVETLAAPLDPRAGALS